MISIVNALGFLGLLANIAFAEPQRMSPLNVCQRINPDSLKSRCFEIIDQAASIDEFAAGVCDRFTSSSLTIECMRTIRDQTFSHAGLLACDRYNNAEQTNACLGTIAGKHLNDAALSACDRINNAQWTTVCLSAIAGKLYQPWQVERCDGFTYAPATVQCFLTSGVRQQ